MRMKIQIVMESESHDTPVTEEIACIQRVDLTPETLGLTLAEAKVAAGGRQMFRLTW